MPGNRSGVNLIVTGTPGVGKSTLCQQLAEKTGLRWLDINQVAKEQNCFQEYDEELKCQVLHEDKLLDAIEDQLEEGGNIIDYHGCDFFPERLVDMVFVLRTNNTVLYDRLAARGYSGRKLEENMQSEIFGVLLEEAQDSYKNDIIMELQSNTPEDMENNVERIAHHCQQWFAQNKQM